MRGKQISITGEKLIAAISLETPLRCLLDDGKTFGDDYKLKEPPQLPHTENCQCQLQPVVHRSEEWFATKRGTADYELTDLGRLDKNEYRYYKYWLIAHHADADESTRREYWDLADIISVSADFKERVNRHLGVDPNIK